MCESAIWKRMARSSWTLTFTTQQKSHKRNTCLIKAICHCNSLMCRSSILSPNTSPGLCCVPVCFGVLIYFVFVKSTVGFAGRSGAGIAQWLEHRTRDWKVTGSNPCWNGGRIFFSRVDFLCWLLFRYPFHPRVTTVARKKSRSFCQKCRWQVTAKHPYTLRMWILLNRASALVTTCP